MRPNSLTAAATKTSMKKAVRALRTTSTSAGCITRARGHSQRNLEPRHGQRYEYTSAVSHTQTDRLSLSYAQGPIHPPLAHSTLPAFWNDTILHHYADRPALICRSEKPRPHGGPKTGNLGIESHLAWSFGEMNEQVKALARGLVGLGVKKGDRVGVIMGNNRYVCSSAIEPVQYGLTSGLLAVHMR